MNSRWHLWPSMRCYALLHHIYKHCPVFFLRSWFSPEKELERRRPDPKHWHIHRISPSNFSGLGLRVLSLPVVDIASLNLFEARAMSTDCGHGSTAQAFGQHDVLLSLKILWIINEWWISSISGQEIIEMEVKGLHQNLNWNCLVANCFTIQYPSVGEGVAKDRIHLMPWKDGHKAEPFDSKTIQGRSHPG